MSRGPGVSNGRTIRSGQGFNRGGRNGGQWAGRGSRNYAGRGWRGGPGVSFAFGAGYYGYDDDGYSSYGYDPSAGDDSYCAARFHSYDPRSGTYLGYDGQRHPCP